MNSLTSKQRKLLYVGCIVVLLIPIIGLGMPGTAEESGGHLARLRVDYDLGESTLGKVDPTSASMNLVLLGLRGVASTKLWMDAQEQQEQKDWGRLRSTTDSIILLQPHFMKVWDFQGWNLAYNVSAEWDAVPDRYYWVKEGAKFLMRGTNQNETVSELYFFTARILGPKIGESDEWRYFRRYFNEADPDPDFEGRPDESLNKSPYLDNYVRSQEWFQEANERELESGQNVMQRMLYRSNAYKSKMSWAQALQKEGKFGQRTAEAWAAANREWTGVAEDGSILNGFGQEDFFTPAGRIRLEATESDLAKWAEEDDTTADEKRDWLEKYRARANYRYWKMMSRCEQQPATAEAHRLIHEGKNLFRNGETSPRGDEGELPSAAEEKLRSGLALLEKQYAKFPAITEEDSVIEDIMISQMFLMEVYEINNLPLPTSFPLKFVWDENANRRDVVEELFLRQIR